MGLGIRLRKLWKLRIGVITSLALALLAAAWTTEQISLFPPGLTPKKLDLATAATHVVVDRQRSAILDLRTDTSDFESLTNRAVLLGNVIANGEVRANIARSAHVPLDKLVIAAPLTPKQPAAQVDPANRKKPSDIFKGLDEYRITILADPTVPFLDIFTQAESVKTAQDLANAAVTSLQTYLGSLARSEGTPQDAQIRLMQLGRAHGSIVNKGAHYQTALVVFILTFAFSCATVIYIDRVRKGWKQAALAERDAVLT
jgi:hypothetical protein